MSPGLQTTDVASQGKETRGHLRRDCGSREGEKPGSDWATHLAALALPWSQEEGPSNLLKELASPHWAPDSQSL